MSNWGGNEAVMRRLNSMAASIPSGSSAQAGAASSLPAVPWERVERFVGQLTHDVRNGLNALELQLTFLGEISTDPEAVDEIKRLRGTLGNVTRQLQALRLATGGSASYPLEYPAAEFFADLRERFAKMHPGASEKVIWETLVEAEKFVLVDPEQTLNALLELLANALQFAPSAAPPIRVQVSTSPEFATVRLLETQPVGPMIPAEDWGRTPLLTTRRGAYGLGLFRARRCLESESGTLAVDYSSENHLLTTTVTLQSVSPTQP